MTLDAFKNALEKSPASLEQKAYSVLLWHTGVRKSEAFERIVDDAKLTEDLVILDFHKRKKGGEEVPPLNIPRGFFGVNAYLVPWIVEAQALKPSWKRLYVQETTAATRTTAKGKTVTIKRRVGSEVKASWLFPNIASSTAWTVIKKLLGPEFYPHYLRLRKLSSIAKNPQTRSLLHIKSVSGLKSLRAIEAYLGFDMETADEAMRGSE